MPPSTTLWPFAIPPERSRPVALLGGALAICAACAAPPEVRLEKDACASPPAREAIVFVSGAGTRARVTRVPSADGSETLHGETELSLGALTRRCIVEDVTLDPGGRLLRADVSVGPSCDAEAESRTHLDPVGGLVRVTSQAISEQTAPSTVPWIYTPEVLSGRSATTPVAAWVALRASAGAPSLLLVQLERRQASRVPRDQVVVPTELGTTVVLGSDGADVGASFVDRIQMTDYGVTLVRAPRGGEPSI